MLCLGRRIGQRIIFAVGNEEFTVTILDIGRGKVRLGVEAPKSVTVWREEAQTTFVKPGEIERARSKKAEAARNGESSREASRLTDVEWVDPEPGDAGNGA